MSDSVHGYHPLEARRLADQARALEQLLHHDTVFADGSTVLEAGCGTGAQTLAVARRNPGARIVAVDRSAESLALARQRIAAAGLTGIRFEQADLMAPPWPPASFDHLLLCFVLEHLPAPATTLQRLLPLLRPGGTVTVIEGDHGSVLMHPDNPAARAAINCQVELQRRGGGDANIGRRLFPLLRSVGVADLVVSPRPVYVDAGHPDLVEDFVLDTFTAMIAGVRDASVKQGLLSASAFDAGLAALRRTTEPDGVFSYTFFKATARRLP